MLECVISILGMILLHLSHMTCESCISKIHLFGHMLACSGGMMDWVVVLGSSRQALSINGSIESKYRCFANRLNSVGGLECGIQGQSQHQNRIFQKKIDCKATS